MLFLYFCDFLDFVLFYRRQYKWLSGPFVVNKYLIWFDYANDKHWSENRVSDLYERSREFRAHPVFCR